MKTLKSVAVILVLAQVIYYQIGHAYATYGTLFTHLSENIIQLIQMSFLFLNDAALLACGLVFFFSSIPPIKDRAYSLLRFMYVLSGILSIPTIFLMIFKVGLYGRFPMNSSFLTLMICLRLVTLITVVLLYIAKPDKVFKKVDLTDYQMVSYTSGWHRFMHNILDSLFLFPIIFSWIGLLERAHGALYGIVLLVYLLYFFLAELLFGQTFGKMITRSCLVSNGVPLSTGRVLERSFARLIPFDKFSFLFGANWHDRISNTSVVYIDTWQNVFEEDADSHPYK